MKIQFKTMVLGLFLLFGAVSAHAERLPLELRKAYGTQVLELVAYQQGYEVVPSSVELGNSYNPFNLVGQTISQALIYGTDFEVISFKLQDSGKNIYSGWAYLSTAIGCTTNCKAYENAWVKKNALPDGRIVYSQIYTLLPEGNNVDLHLEVFSVGEGRGRWRGGIL